MDEARDPDLDAPFTAVVSLGPTCASKYQIGRHAFFKSLPEATDDDYRRLVWSDQPKPFGTYVFDWQITPTSALLTYLETDFAGAFERGDLDVAEDGSDVTNRRFGTRHPHSFHALEGEILAPALLDEQYPNALRKFEYLAEKTRRQLRSTDRTLYVLREQPQQHVVSHLASLLSAHPAHRFHLLLVEIEGGQNNAGYDLAHVSTAVVPEKARNKDESRQWEGDDAAWDAILGKFPLAAWSK